MEKRSKAEHIQDPGIGLSFERPVERLLGSDGRFKVERVGGLSLIRQGFLYLTTISAPRFLLFVFAAYALVVLLFAFAYMLVGVEQLQGAELGSLQVRWKSALGFSVQTLTTVGYGHIAPVGCGAWFLAAIESMFGILGLGLMSAITYARIARPRARLLFSERALIAPFRNGWSVQVRLANQRDTLMMDVKARLLVVLADVDGQGERLNYYQLPLQLNEITFLPLSWTLVHEIDGNSPLASMTEKDLQDRRAELLVVISGMDESYGQVVHARRSYRWDECIWGARFDRAFAQAPSGGWLLHMEKVHAFSRVEAPEHLPS